MLQTGVRGRVAAVQESLQTMKGELVKEQQRSAGLERSRAAFVAVWRGNRMRSGAARAIQRHFRARRMLQLLDRTRLNAKVGPAASQQAAGAAAVQHGSGSDHKASGQAHVIVKRGKGCTARSARCCQLGTDTACACCIFCAAVLQWQGLRLGLS